jgi:ferritin-like metal-binding protein YciE
MPAITSLKDLLVDELKDLYSAEQQLVKALPKMSKASTHADLKDGFNSHLEETRGHVQRLEEAFSKLGVPAKAKTCKAMQGLIAEGAEAIDLDATETLRDACLIGAAQRVEHYEIAAYGTVATPRRRPRPIVMEGAGRARDSCPSQNVSGSSCSPRSQRL